MTVGMRGRSEVVGQDSIFCRREYQMLRVEGDD